MIRSSWNTMSTTGRILLALLVNVAMAVTVHAEAMVSLKGHVSKSIQSAVAMDNVAADERIDVSLGMRIDQQKLDQAVQDVLRSPDPAHRTYLTPEQFAAQFGLAEKREKLKAYALAHGLTVDDSTDQAESMVVNAHANASQLEKAFRIHLHHYRGQDGKVFRAHDTDPQVDASAVAFLGGVFGLSNESVALPNVRFSPKKAKARTSLTSGVASATPNSLIGTGPDGVLAPKDIKSIYGLSSVTSAGTGQSVALMELDGYIPTDATTYSAQFGFPAPSVSVQSTDGLGNTCGSARNLPCTAETLQTEQTQNYNGMVEVGLDIDMILAFAPASHIQVYEAPNSYQGIFDVYNKIATDNKVSVVSTSWNIYESQVPTSYLVSENQIFQRMLLEGISVFSASGDQGSSSILDPATQPYVTAVGGTTLGGTLQSPSETNSWNDEAGASGGGISTYWPIPSYQVGLAGTASQRFRNVPDVALNADPDTGYGTVLEGEWFMLGGTSASAPLWAALAILVNQQRAALGDARLGFANMLLYPLGKSASHAAYFNDIISGTNGNYNALPGYDNVTGLGTFFKRGSALLAALVPGGPTSNARLNPPTHLTLSAPTATSLRLSWTASTGTVVAAYHVDVSATRSFATTLAAYTNVYVGNVTTVLLNGLQASTTYYARARAYDSANHASANSNPAAGVTSYAAPNPPTHLSLASPTASSLTLSWTASTGTLVDAYHVDLSTSSSFATDVTGYRNDWVGNVTSIVVKGLRSATTYYARVRAYSFSNHPSANSVVAAGVTARTSANTSASFLKSDLTTHGSWKGIYGVDGEAVCLDSTRYPAYAQVSLLGATPFSWARSTTDLRALEKAGAYDRWAVAWLSHTTLTFDINFPDGASHQVALYAVDWLSEGAQERIDILDAGTLAVLDSRTLTNFSQGEYLLWALKGHVFIRITNLSKTFDVQASGIFFGTPVAPVPNAFVTSRALGVIRNNWSGWVGMKIQVGAKPLSVTGLGRIVVGSNRQTHQVKLVSAATGQDIPGASVAIGPGGTAYNFKYVSLPKAVTLAANAQYYVVTHEFNGGDYWYDDNSILTPSADGSIASAIYSTDSAPKAWSISLTKGHAFGPVDFIYKVAGTSVEEETLPTPVILSQTAATSAGGLSASYDPSYPVQSFEWSVDDVSAASDRPADLSDSGGEPVTPPAPVVLTAAQGSNGTLSPDVLTPKAGSTVVVHVTAILSDGRRSPTASTTLSVPQTVAKTNALDSVVVFPNPFRAARGDTHITFNGMPSGSTVKLFTLSGHFIKTIDGPGLWDMTNDSGDKVASGLYLYLITTPQGDKTRGKLAVIR